MIRKGLIVSIIVYSIAVVSCAKKGSITGGAKDTLAPILKLCKPENYTTNFKGNKFVVTFDEFVVLKNINKQLIVSPPMKNDPIISPTTASYFIDVKILDTLEANTTYCFNFGQSIVDYNESNPYNQFKYVFSTGDYIDSLEVKGTIRNAYEVKPQNFISVMLYNIDEKFTDSIIYKEVPRYITNTLDSARTFKLENLKEGKYLLVGIKDDSRNNKYNPKDDILAFYQNIITVPSDSIYDLRLFTEKQPFAAKNAFLGGKNRIVVGYEGDLDLAKPNVGISLKKGEDTLKTIVTKFPEKDSLQVWFPPQEVDSLALEVTKEDYNKKFTVRMRKAKADTLNFKATVSGTLHLSENFKIHSETPITKIDNSMMKLISKDSTEVKFTTEYDEFYQELSFLFEKKQEEKYNLQLLPSALTDFLGKQNDTLSYNFSTLKDSEYGTMIIKLEKVKQFPVIVDLTTKEGKTVQSIYLESNEDVVFKNLQPQTAKIRVIYDANKNGKWDTGNYLKKLQPEEVIYYPDEIILRANWDAEYTFDLSIKENIYEEENEEVSTKK